MNDYKQFIKDKCQTKCGWCAYCQGMEIGDTVMRQGNDGKIYEYEVDSIDKDGECIDIVSDEANPSYAYIMADDCTLIKDL